MTFVSFVFFLKRKQKNTWKMNEFEYKTVAERSHTTYRKNINLEKCAGLGLNGFIPKKINTKKREEDPASSYDVAC